MVRIYFNRIDSREIVLLSFKPYNLYLLSYYSIMIASIKILSYSVNVVFCSSLPTVVAAVFWIEFTDNAGDVFWAADDVGLA